MFDVALVHYFLFIIFVIFFSGDQLFYIVCVSRLVTVADEPSNSDSDSGVICKHKHFGRRAI